MTAPNPLSPEQKARIRERIHNFLAATQTKEKPFETFKRTLLWMIEANSAMQMMELTRTGATGTFKDVARYLEKKDAEEEQEAKDEQ